MDLILIGMNHKTAPVEIRNRASISELPVKEFLSRLKEEEFIGESLLLSTCDRTELYSFGTEVESRVRAILKEEKPTNVFNNGKFDYTMYNDGAVRHIFRVAGGLDSTIVGESQILGQVKNSYDLSCECGTSGVFLSRLVESAFRVGKRARTETDIGIGAVSVSHAAVELALKIFESLKQKTVLLIGASEKGELTARHLMEKEIGELFITRRIRSNAGELENSLGGTTVDFDQLDQTMQSVDIVISSTGSEEYLLTYQRMLDIMRHRGNNPIFIIDIAVPRDVDPKVNNLSNVFLYDIDSLNIIVDKNLEFRISQIPQVEQIVEEEFVEFMDWYKALEVTPTIKSLCDQFEKIRVNEINKNLKRFADGNRKEIDNLTKNILNKILHTPLSKIRECGKDSEDGLLKLDTVRKLFELGDKS